MTKERQKLGVFYIYLCVFIMHILDLFMCMLIYVFFVLILSIFI